MLQHKLLDILTHVVLYLHHAYTQKRSDKEHATRVRGAVGHSPNTLGMRAAQRQRSSHSIARAVMRVDAHGSQPEDAYLDIIIFTNSS